MTLWECDKSATKFFHPVIEYHRVYFSPEICEKIEAGFDCTDNFTEQSYGTRLAAFYPPVFGHTQCSASPTVIIKAEKMCLENTVQVTRETGYEQFKYKSWKKISSTLDQLENIFSLPNLSVQVKVILINVGMNRKL